MPARPVVGVDAPRGEPLHAHPVLFVSGPVKRFGSAAGTGRWSTCRRGTPATSRSRTAASSSTRPRSRCADPSWGCGPPERGQREALAERAVEGRVLRTEQALVGAGRCAAVLSSRDQIHVLRGPSRRTRGILSVGDRRHDVFRERAGRVLAPDWSWRADLRLEIRDGRFDAPLSTPAARMPITAYAVSVASPDRSS